MTKINTKTNLSIYLGADHRGYALKQAIKQFLEKNKYDFNDLGNNKYQIQDDYPDFAKLVISSVSQKNQTSRGILICGSGIGMAIVANRNAKIRAGLCWNQQITKAARNDDDINVLVLPSDFINKTTAFKTIQIFLNTPFSGKSKHLRRIKKLNK